MHVAMIGVFLFALKPPATESGTIGIVGAGISTCACILWSVLVLPKPQPIAKFQANVLVGLAFAELVMLLGTFMGGDPTSTWKYAATAWALIFVFILPRVLTVP